jgi:uncharacterized protein YkwD
MHYIKTVSATFLILGSAAADAFSDQVLDAHNVARMKYGAANLTWSTTLYPNTAAYASLCVFSHSVYNSFNNL